MRGRRTGPLRAFVLLAVTTAALAQSPPDRVPAPGTPLQLPSLPGQPTPAPAEPDTAVAVISGPGGWPVPASVQLWPENPPLGAAVALVLDFAAPVVDFAADSLRVSGAWLELQPAAKTEPLVQGLPPATGWRAVVAARPYHLGPARVRWAGGPQSPVVDVAGRLPDGAEAEPVRAPRSLGWYWTRLAVAALLAAGLAFLAWRLWPGRRRGATGPVDRELPPPAYLRAALRLHDLAAAGLPERGEGRTFLDRLAAILRGYLAGRFGLAAAERTAAEIAARGREAGWPREDLAGFVELIGAADRDRYAPDAIGGERCRADLERAVALIAAVRVEARYTPVEARLREEGEAAWSDLAAAAREGAPC